MFAGAVKTPVLSEVGGVGANNAEMKPKCIIILKKNN
jgi:hypothetical protein